MQFTKMKVDSLAYAGAEVQFREITGDGEFVIVARPDGIFFRGRSPVMKDKKDMDPLARAIGQAMLEVEALSKGLKKSLVIPGQDS